MIRILSLLAFATLAPQMSLAFSDEHTAQPVSIIKNGTVACGRLETVYQFDCYRQVFREAANTVSGRPDYDKARSALKDVEQTLDRVVRQNRDLTRPTLRYDGKRINAIRPDAVPAAIKSFDAVRSTAVTELLRADGKAKLHYARIAEVVGSTKVLIRSQLRMRLAALMARTNGRVTI